MQEQLSNDLDLLETIRCADYEEATRVLKTGADVDSVSYENTIGISLHYAVRWGYYKIVDLLIRNGASVNKKNPDGCTPLILAVLWEHPEVVALLLKSRADPNIADNTEVTPMYYAACCRNMTMLAQLIESRACLNPIDKDGETPLDGAINILNENTVNLLLAAIFSKNLLCISTSLVSLEGETSKAAIETLEIEIAILRQRAVKDHLSLWDLVIVDIDSEDNRLTTAEWNKEISVKLEKMDLIGESPILGGRVKEKIQDNLKKGAVRAKALGDALEAILTAQLNPGLESDVIPPLDQACLKSILKKMDYASLKRVRRAMLFQPSPFVSNESLCLPSAKQANKCCCMVM